MPNVKLRIELENTDPLVWREFVVPQQINLRTLHSVIQDVMGWEEEHLYEFECAGRYYGEPDPDVIGNQSVAMASNAKLSTLLPKIKSHELRYTYDFGDGWEHRLALLETSSLAAMHTPWLLAGEMACPPEDIGGIMGYEALKAALRGEEDEHGQMILEGLGGEFDPQALDIELINEQLEPIRRRFRRR
ncbi:plasmid pRiA4b ORF-3 family protein [Kushneria aurantia]|uniref:Plasmid pRiA4b ORF-3 family protein n=1 Tax=Kushneria aurantia TaxID=504092 RepID=A0ABV6G6F3_9GAMM|nr:plasmid pRiA4b ORF-3 family protein [Kushneria aurantia]